VWVDGVGKVVNPHGGGGVLIRERHGRSLTATGARTTATHVTKVPIVR
jgi:hypothetical protein